MTNRQFIIFAGRVHTAVVSGINWETKSVTVEWFERNETKGKEVRMIYSLNCVNIDKNVTKSTFKFIPDRH